ncbi:hypothetical protein Poli38472_013070 [Pythium oligandrum]|uniref:Dienelactone hydrolase domain-containing protein n=1 Tax=Pythium oligandrum TaxID=41045 RepID=A0A8K1CLB7_PYTOL|nr:hypothetical protein Poli38472_013070 [Pythium oligandrum]|eukprot:TMW64448.1 hypothetical protein Poli38472_013070 [Pythium oligandrum]
MSSCCPPNSEPAREASPYVGSSKVFGKTCLYVAGPATTRVGVLAFPDMFGCDSGRTKEDVDRLAQEGYVVVLVDLTNGVWPTSSEEVQANLAEWMRKTDYDSVMKPSIDDAIAYLKQEAQVEDIVCYGYCLGSWVGARLSTLSPSVIKGNVSFHPSWTWENMVNGEGALEKLTDAITVPQLLLSVSNDPDAVRTGGLVEKILKEKSDIASLSEVVDFEHVKHGWVNRGDLSDEKVKIAVDEAWGRARAFIKKITTQ